MADDRKPDRCEQCGAVDTDHKVVFWGVRTVHADCMSADEQAMYGQPEATYGPDPEAIRAAAVAGTRGDDLLALTREDQG